MSTNDEYAREMSFIKLVAARYAVLRPLYLDREYSFMKLSEISGVDEANLSRFLNLMKKIKTQTQFIIITHNSKTMEVADYIYGTTMAEPSITSIFSVRMEKNRAG